eukprot:TRINITY_DN2040_c0_g1_i1.p2 TRINITY_DN2040_c0_g1~~TRINITY_DN2040_c0_g1_i1.p2  ORF type:complete len:236 (-),score=50.37 TRINITY_DN2040_c0_g1_i1:189-896(-)
MLSLWCYLCVLGLLCLSVVSQEGCLVSLQLDPELTSIKVGGALKAPLPAPLFDDVPDITLQGQIVISMAGVECPANLEQIDETMTAAESISIVAGGVPPLTTSPDSIVSTVLGLADLTLSGLQIEISNDDVSFDEVSGSVSAENTQFTIVNGAVEITSSLIADTQETLGGLDAQATMTGNLDGSTLTFSDVNIVIPVDIEEQGIPVSAEVTLSGTIGGEIVPFEGDMIMAPVSEP